MKRRLAIAAWGVVLGLVGTFIVGLALVSSGSSKLRLTRVRPNIYRTVDPPTFFYYTRDCTAAAHRTTVTLSLGDTLWFPTGESCYCPVILPWTRQEDLGVVRTALLDESR
jgi:hypothetical protein